MAHDDSTLEVQSTRLAGAAAAAKAPHVTVVLYHREGTSLLELRQPGSAVVGRAFPADIVLPEPSLSRLHARFTWDEHSLTVTDLASRNGTRRAGKPIHEARLCSGDELRLGEVTAVVHVAITGMQDHGLESYDQMMRRLREETLRTREVGRPFAFALLHSLGGEDIYPLGAELRATLRPIDHLGVYDHRMAMLLLPETSAAAAETAVRKLLSATRAWGQLAAGVAVYPDAAASAEELLAVCRSACMRVESPGALALVRAPHESAAAETGATVLLAPQMLAIQRVITQVATRGFPILIVGETGAGKEIAATAVHEASGRSGPLKVVNCATIPISLTESILFGHEKGAFTGATARASGLFEEAQGGTLFLDEVGELSAGAQAALLRAVQEKRIMRVGSTREIEIDVRVVAATHRNLAQMAERGQFRTDLLYRLNAVTLEIPPLRERVCEVMPLAKRFLERAIADWGGAARSFSPEVVAVLESYDWPGNVRELRNVIERAAALCDRELIGVEELPSSLRGAQPSGIAGPLHAAVTATVAPSEPDEPAPLPADRRDQADDGAFRDRVRDFEIALIRDALEKSGGNLTLAAQLLGMPIRTMTHKVKAYGLRD